MYEFLMLCKIKNGLPYVLYKYNSFNELLEILPIFIESKKKYGVVIENETFKSLGDSTGDYHLTLVKRLCLSYEIL